MAKLRESTDFSSTHHVPDTHNLLLITIPHHMVRFLQLTNLQTRQITQSLSFTLGLVHSCCCMLYGFGQIHTDCIHHHSIIQTGFTALKILCFLFIHPSPHTFLRDEDFNIKYLFLCDFLLTALFLLIRRKRRE